MKRSLLITILCCAIPLVIALVVFRSQGKRSSTPPADRSSTPSGSTVGVRVDNRAPSFQLTDLDGKPVTNERLAGKPAILWFTASYCVPCQLGAKEVRQLDDDLNGGAFNVVMVFIDPRESEADLRDWRQKFGNPDWVIAFGNEQLTADYAIRYLDTQYLLDSQGVIRNVANTAVGYEGYKTKIEAL